MKEEKILRLTIPATKKHQYPIIISPNLLHEQIHWSEIVTSQQVCIVTNQTIAEHYLEPLKQRLTDKTILTVFLEDGERYKTLAAVSLIWDKLMQARFNRDATIIALGGGIVGDVAGYAAASYQRGIKVIQVPTTLLAQVDSSVGGKTGVNHPQGKNMIGAFHQPQAVMIDVNTLRTLPTREFSAGLAEVIKYGLINDEAFFAWLEQHMDKILAKNSATLTEMIAQCCQHKAAIVMADEKEAGQRALLNLGHTFGHAIETLTNYQQFKHGEAVAIGIRVVAELSKSLGNLSEDEVIRIRNLLLQANLPDSIPNGLKASAILELMYHDKKVAQGKLRLILMQRFAQAIITDHIADGQILTAIGNAYS